MPQDNSLMERFESLMSRVNRDGKDDLMAYIRKTDFYKAPSSTRFHLSCEGGLLQHSLNVYDCLMAKKKSPVWGPILSNIDDESLIIMALLHDLCKANMYFETIKNKKSYDPEVIADTDPRQIKHDSMGDYVWQSVIGYDIDEQIPIGHGEKSIILIMNFMKLKANEIFAIRWHMGYSEEKANYRSLDAAIEKYPIALALHEADLEASKLIEGTDQNIRSIFPDDYEYY